MSRQRRAVALRMLCAFLCVAPAAQAADLSFKDDVRPSAWIVELGGYGVFEPTYEGSKHYGVSIKPLLDFHQSGDKVWLSFPNDALSYDLYETSNFHAGPAASVTLKSRYHGDDVDLSLGKAEVNLEGGAFAEYYPVENVRMRVEFLQGIAGNNGFAFNLSADYIWHPYTDWTLTIGPRAQIVNDQYASDYFSTQLAQKNHRYVSYHAEGGVLSTGAEFTGVYDWTKTISTKVFVDYNQLMGDAADSPRVNLKGSTDQVTVGVGASYKFTIER